MLNVYEQITIKTLHQQGLKQSEIARQLGCHRNTVRNVLNQEIRDGQTREKSSGCSPYHETIQGLWEDEVNKIRIHEILRDEYDLQLSYSAVCAYIRKHFPKRNESYGVCNTQPGEEAEFDFGYLGKLPGPSGELVKTWGLVVILSYSRCGYYETTYDQTLETLVKGLINAFRFFGGVPKTLKIDNLKPAVTKNQGKDLEFNRDFLEFAHYYGFVVKPCTPRKPNQKGKVESGVKYLQGNFVSGRNFQDQADLQKQMVDWTEKANGRVHGTTKKIPTEMLATEELLPLPTEEYAFFQRTTRKVQKNSHVYFEDNYYSVPSYLQAKEITLRWDDHLVRVIYRGEEVALHHRVKGTGEYVTVRSHLPDYKVYSENEYQLRYENRMRKVGQNAHTYFKYLLETKPKDWARRVRGILGLLKDCEADVLEQTLKRAQYYEVTDLSTVKAIIRNKDYLEETEPFLPKKASYELSRNLNYYG